MRELHTRHVRSLAPRWRLMTVLLLTCLLLVAGAGPGSTPALLAIVSQRMQGHTSRLTHKLDHPAIAPNSVAVAEREGTQGAAQQYMAALFQHRYSAMWTLLHPQVQALWPGEAAFATYWQKRFQHYTLLRFTPGAVQGLDRWVNPESMLTYRHVFVLPISLQLEPDQSIRRQALAPVEDLHPDALFAHLPFIVQKVSGPAHGQARWAVLNGGPADLEAPILPPITPLFTAVRVPILMYHHISNSVPATALGMSLTVTPGQFDQQLTYLNRLGYHTITFNQLFDALYYGGPLPAHPLMLTFDDGYEDAYRFALPLLRAHGFSGMFYIITGKVGWNAYLNWQQIRRMSDAGMQIGSHTVHHVDMGSLVLYSQALAQQELQNSLTALQKHLGMPIQQFCYPAGEPFQHGSMAARQQVMALLAADGYVGATTDPGLSGSYQYSTAPYILLRIRVDGRSSLQSFTYSLGA